MSSLGELYFALGLDDKKFNEALEAAKKKVAELGADVTVGIKIDTESIGKQIKAEFDKIQGGGNVKIGIDDSNLKRIREDLAKAKAELAELNSAKFKNTSDIGRKEGWIKTLEIQEQKELARLQTASKPVKVDVELNQEAVAKVRQQLSSLENPIKTKISVEYDNEKFQAATTALKNYTDQLNNIGKIRLGIDDSFLRTGAGFEKGKGVKGFLSNVSDYLLGDDTGEANRSIGQIQKILNNYTFKLKTEVDQQLLINSLNAISKKKVSLNVGVNMDIAAIQKKLNALKVPLTLNSKQAIDDIKSKLKNETFKAKLNLVVDKAKVSKAVRAALERQGLNYNTTPSDVRAKRIDEIQQRMEHRQKKFDGQVKKSLSSTNRLGSSMKVTADWAGQLANQFSNFISIYAIERFIRNLYTIGGEFQKQQIALRNMIGDVTKADSTFERLKDLAVVSPFTFSELSSYTKQMAAYGIEYEELYDTTKLLADISAGVGVDMGRLILAYGQVRSAEVLRGQELRQFTEAGIPLVAELAKRLEEVRGESVKVGEVFDAISKRQVSFGMVKDVLFDMTDPGGRFFEMQEELAKSLAGQWSNLKDAWDIMIADIANSLNNTLSNLAGIAADILRNWRGWIPALAAIATSIGVVTSAIRVATTVTTIWNAVTSANPWAAAITAILGAAGAIGGYVLASSVAEKNTSQVNTELEAQIQKWSENRSNALRYIDTIKSSNTSEERRIQLYNELLDLYPSIFENMKMEQLLLADTANLKTQINDATKAMSIGEITKLIKEERKKIREAEGDSVERGTFNGQEYKIIRKQLTEEQNSKIRKAEARIAELEAKAAEIQKNITREGLIEKLTPDSSLSKYVEVYHNLAKAVKILRQGGVKGEISNPKEFTSTLEYYDQLSTALKEQEEIAGKFKIGTSERTEADKLVKVYRDAISAIGGIWDTSKSRKRMSDAAKVDMNAYIEALKNEIARIGKQWDLFKDLLEASGNKNLSMNIAFGGQISFDNQLEQLKSRIMDEAKKFGVGINLNDLLSLGEKQLLEQGVSEKAAKAIGALIDAYNKESAKLKDESVRNFIEILNASKDFEQQIADVERKLQNDLASLRKGAAEGKMDVNSEEYKRAERKLRENAEKDKADIRLKEFKESSDWVKVFDDLDRVATPTLDSMLEKMEGFVHQIEESPEAMKELLKAIGDMREKLAERDPFGTFSRSLEKLRNINSARWLLAGNPRYTFQQDLYGFKKGQTVTRESLDNMEQGVYNDISSAIDGTSKAFENLQNVLKPLIDLFGDGAGVVGKFLDGIGDALGGAVSMSNSLKDVMGLSIGKGTLGDKLGIKNAGMWGAIAGAGLSIAGSLMDAFGADYSSYNKMKEEYDSLLGVWDALIDRKKEYIDIDYADEARKVGQEALDILDKQIEAYKTLGKERLNAGASIGSHSIGYRIKKYMSDEGWNEFYEAAKSIGFNAEKVEADRMEGLFDLSANQLAQLQEKAPVFWAKLDEDVREYLENIIESNDALEDMRDTLNETLTGSSLDAFYDNYISMISDLDKTNQDFAESFEEYLKNAIIANVIGNKYRDAIEKLYQDWANMSDTNKDGKFDLTPEESEALKKAQDDLTNQLIAEREALKEAFGWTSSSSSSGLSKGVQSVTEDTANLLASYVNAIRSDCSVERALIERLIGDDIPKINYIAEAQLVQLNAIASNTLRNANAADKIYDLMNRMSDKGSNKWRI